MTEMIPRTEFALISGSAAWGMNFPSDVGEPGVRTVESGMEFETPYGTQQGWQLLEFDAHHTVDGRARPFLNLYSHGWPADSVDPRCHQKAFWILREAGVRRVLSDSTCGSLNRALRPLDFVIIGDVMDFSGFSYSVLPGRLRWLCRGDELICREASDILEREARQHWLADARVYGRRHELVVAGVSGPRFETPAEVRAYVTLGADLVNQSIAQEATHAREIGACFVSSSYVTNYVSGLFSHPDFHDDLDQAHQVVKERSARISLRSMAQLPNGSCSCHARREPRSTAYLDAARRQLGLRDTVEPA